MKYIHNIPILRDIQRRIRQKRVDLFLRDVNPDRSWKILDVGGTYPTWEQKGMDSFQVTLLNLRAAAIPSHLASRMTSEAGDATNLPYGTQSFDLVYSNSVIEHVGSAETQKKFAVEALRVGQALWIQTPTQEFLSEPHYMAFFVHWFPRAWQSLMLRWGSLWGLLNKPTRQQCDEYVQYNQLLTYKRVQELFPGCRIIRERFFGLTKSHIVVKPYSSAVGATEVEAG